MKKSNNYLFFSILFFFGYLVVQFTDIYGDSTWFKAFLIIISFTFMSSGISMKRKE